MLASRAHPLVWKGPGEGWTGFGHRGDSWAQPRWGAAQLSQTGDNRRGELRLRGRGAEEEGKGRHRRGTVPA